MYLHTYLHQLKYIKLFNIIFIILNYIIILMCVYIQLYFNGIYI